MNKEIKRILFMELDSDGRPFNVIVEDKDGYTHDICFEYSKKYGTNYYYNAGSGPNDGTTVRQTYCGGEMVLTRFWAADDFEVTIDAELHERVTEQPFTEEQMFSVNYYPEDGQERFEESGGMQYCRVCDDWLPDYDEGDCPHLKWDDWWGCWIGTGADEIEPKEFKKSVFAVLKIIGPSAAKHLRRMLLSRDYLISWCINDLELIQKIRAEGRRNRRVTCPAFRYIETEGNKHLDRGLNWLDTLHAGKTDKEDMITVSWISEWLADKPSRRKPLPDGFTVHRKGWDDYELKYLGYPSGTYDSVEDVEEIIQKAQEKACEQYPCLHDNEALSKYMNNLVNYREHRDRAS